MIGFVISEVHAALTDMNDLGMCGSTLSRHTLVMLNRSKPLFEPQIPNTETDTASKNMFLLNAMFSESIMMICV